MKKTGVKLTGLFLACTLAIAPAAYVSAEEKGETLVYGSGDYTRINPAMDEHGEINVLIFNGLTGQRYLHLYLPSFQGSKMAGWRGFYGRGCKIYH